MARSTEYREYTISTWCDSISDVWFARIEKNGNPTETITGDKASYDYEGNIQ